MQHVDGTQPYTPEVLFHRTIDRFGSPIVSQSTARNYGQNQLTGQKAAQGSQNYLDKFEMKDGSRYKIDYDTDEARRWDDRDNRYDFNFYMHGDKVDKITLDFSATKLSSDGAVNSNAVRKFLSDGVTKNNPGLAAFCNSFITLG